MQDNTQVNNHSTVSSRTLGHSLKKILILFLFIGLFIFLSHYLGLGSSLGLARDWIKSLGYMGPVAFIFIYAFAVTALFPGSALTVAAGALFGSFWGIVIVSVASTLGSGLSFLIARYFARDFVEHWVQKQKKFKKLDELVKTHGEIIVAVTRLVPLFPYTLLNYGFGLTKISFKTYISWSWLCMLPGTVLYVVGSDAVVETIINKKVEPGRIIALVVVLVFIGAAAKYAKQILKRSLQ
ncbi:MAG: TVP38/TMEM64 family protein [Elusimicrobia bacterium]|nr:TVP38/TMEM64 family protein [Candidatus Liberimonas magnetica]